MKPLGQHFLKNPALIEKIIGALDVHAGETIIEIGPGHGELTIPFAEACGKIDAGESGDVGVKIIAIEKDEKLAVALRAKIEMLKIKNVEVVSGDALLILPSILAPLSSFKIAGNIPYYITGHLLRVISELPAKPERCIFMIQAEVAQRIRAVPPRMNRLAASVQFWAEPKTIAHVAKTDFSPPPEVDSAVIQLDVKKASAKTRRATTKLETPSLETQKADQYYAAVRALFAQPRKTIFNNLRTGDSNKEGIEIALSKLGIDPKSRPQDLTIENIMEIAACPDLGYGL